MVLCKLPSKFDSLESHTHPDGFRPPHPDTPRYPLRCCHSKRKISAAKSWWQALCQSEACAVCPSASRPSWRSWQWPRVWPGFWICRPACRSRRDRRGLRAGMSVSCSLVIYCPRHHHDGAGFQCRRFSLRRQAGWSKPVRRHPPACKPNTDQPLICARCREHPPARRNGFCPSNARSGSPRA